MFKNSIEMNLNYWQRKFVLRFIPKCCYKKRWLHRGLRGSMSDFYFLILFIDSNFNLSLLVKYHCYKKYLRKSRKKAKKF